MLSTFPIHAPCSIHIYVIGGCTHQGSAAAHRRSFSQDSICVERGKCCQPSDDRLTTCRANALLPALFRRTRETNAEHNTQDPPAPVRDQLTVSGFRSASTHHGFFRRSRLMLYCLRMAWVHADIGGTAARTHAQTTRTARPARQVQKRPSKHNLTQQHMHACAWHTLHRREKWRSHTGNKCNDR
jgi:hypothetical protein